MNKIQGKIGVVIIHYGRSDPTLRCLASVIADPSSAARQIVVVDNFGNLKATQLGEGVTLIRQEDNPGFGGGANIGVESFSDRDDLSAYLILNNDVELTPGFLDGVVLALNSDRSGAAGGPIRSGIDPSALWYAGGGIRHLTGTVHQSRSPSDAVKAREVRFIPGTAIAVKAAAWHDIGGFDESFFLYNEDIDLCLRLRRKGWRLRFEPTMACIHHLGETTGSAHRSALYLEQITLTRLQPFKPWIYQVYLCWVHSFYNLARVATLIARRGRASRTQVQAVWRGHFGAMAGVFGLRKPKRTLSEQKMAERNGFQG